MINGLESGIYGDVAFSQKVLPQDPLLVPLPRFISSSVIKILDEHQFRFLFKHQLDTLEAIINGNNVVLSTGTASGKSLCYQIPIMDMIINDPKSTALLLFPTKALTQDQRKSLITFIPEKVNQISIYDGDTPREIRNTIRAEARIVFTNPDMLHMGILPYHAGWIRFFQNLKFVILDEAHIYKGIFGAHIANVIRRLLRITEHTGASPQFILCSATLSNANQLAEKLIGQPVKAFSNDYSGNGERKVIFINPPIINKDLFLRAGAIYTAAKISKELLKSVRQMLLFCQSRQSVEMTVRRLRDFDIDASGYRSGYLAKERRKIESGLKKGETRCVAATNALELGMDIGGMDAVVSIGYPGSIAAMLQRIGRAGRNKEPSVFVMIASQNPIDQYLMHHPEFITTQPCEPVLIDPDNLMIILQHIQCALYEVPFKRGEAYGTLSAEETQDILDYFVSIGIARFSGNQYFWLNSDIPQNTISLRNSGLDRISIIEKNHLSGRNERIGEVDRSSSYWMVHEGAIYFHNGISYRIDELNLSENTALAERFEAFYTTEAQRQSEIDIDEVIMKSEKTFFDMIMADVTVHCRVVSYQKRDNDSHQVLETIPLDLPEETLKTKAFIIVLHEELREKLRAQMLWKNDKNDYGSDWQRIRKQIIDRDQNRCTLCGVSGNEQSLHVHHLIPFRNFSKLSDANDPKNLVTLCFECHRRIEQSQLMRSGLSGFATAFHQMAVLFLESDSGDLCTITEDTSKNFDGLPVIYLHETIPGGTGLSTAIYNNFNIILRAAADLIQNCSCENGCPGCIGPAGENGIGGKAESLAIAGELLEPEP